MGKLQAPQQNSHTLEGYDPTWDFNYSLYGVLTGQKDWGAPLSMTSLDSRGGGDDNFQLTIENQGSGGHLLIPGQMAVEDSGVGIVQLGVVHDVTIGGNLHVSGLAEIGGDLNVAGAGTFGADVGIGGALTVAGPFEGSVIHLTGAASPNDAIKIEAGDVALDNGNLEFGNNFGPIWSPATVPLIFMDSSHLLTLGQAAYPTAVYGQSTTLYDHANTAQLTIAASGPPGVRLEHVGIATPPVAASVLTVAGPSSMTGTVTVVSGGLDVQLGGLAVDAGGIQVVGNSMITGTTTLFGDAAIGASVASQIGFYGATGSTRPNVTGSRGGNVALQNVLAALATLGLVTNSTTP